MGYKMLVEFKKQNIILLLKSVFIISKINIRKGTDIQINDTKTAMFYTTVNKL